MVIIYHSFQNKPINVTILYSASSKESSKNDKYIVCHLNCFVLRVKIGLKLKVMLKTIAN